MTILRDWIVDNGYTQGQFAHEVGVSRTHFGLVMNGHRPPSPILAERIEEFTYGRVSAASIMDGSALGNNGRRRRVRRQGIPKKVLPNNAISFL